MNPHEMTLKEYRKAFPAVRCFQKYSSETRSNLASSHRSGHRQRHSVGEFFYVHEHADGIAFSTHGDAVLCAHKRKVKEAIDSGLFVPPFVLAEHSELT